MLFKIRRLYYVEIFWLLSLITFASLIYLNQTYIGFFFNSDILMFPGVFKDLLLNHGHYKDWSLSPAPHFFPDTLTFLPAFLLTKDIYFQFLISLCIQILLLYGAVKFLYHQFFSEVKATTFSLISISIFYLLIFKKPASVLLAALPLVPAAHIGEFSIGIFFVGMQLKFINNVEKYYRNNTLFFIGIILSFLASLSDLLFFVQFATAIFLVYFIFYLKKIITFNQAVYYGLFPFLAAMLGSLLTKYVVPVDILLDYLAHPSLDKISINTVQKQFFLLINLFKNELNWITVILSVLFYIGSASVACYYSFSKKIKNNASLTARKLLFLSYFIFFSVALSIISIFILSQEGSVSDKYLFPAFFFPILLIFYLVASRNKFEFIENNLFSLASIILVYLLLSVVTLFPKAEFKVKMNYYPEFVSCIDHALHKQGHNGIAQYWDANLISMLSKENLDLVPVLSDLSSFKRSINLKKFKDSYSFAVIDINPPAPIWELDQALIERINGPAKKTVICGDKKLLIYAENSLKIHQ